MALVDKIEYIGYRGSYFKLYLNDQVYENSVTNNNTHNETVTFTLNSVNYVASASTAKTYSTFYLKYLFMTNDDYDWLYDQTNTAGTVTILFDKPIKINKVSVKPNRKGASYINPQSTINVYYKNILITTDTYKYADGGATTDIFTVNIINPHTYFIKSETNYYTITNRQLTQVVDTSAGGITDLSLITPTLIQGLTEPKLVVTSDGEIPSDVVLSTQVKLPPQTIVQKTDVDIQNAEELSNIIVTHTGNAIVKVSCSIDSGMSWLKYDGSNWVATELSEGMGIDTIQGLTSEQLDYITQANKVRFAFYIEPQNIDDNIVLQNIKFSVKKEGLWTSCILNTDYTYGRGTDFIEFTAKKAGDYLINYVEM